MPSRAGASTDRRAGWVDADAPSPDGASECLAPIARVEIVCFSPDPKTTQGESEYVGSLAAARGWRTLQRRC